MERSNTEPTLARFLSSLVSIGLALQGSLANFAGGVLVLLFKQTFDAEGISIPYPQRDVHVTQQG
jgi:small-conductance mechanosensitive channel